MPVLRPQAPLYRIDKFTVPDAALAEFVTLAWQTHEVLRSQSGFVRDLILEQVSGPGQFNAVTFVESKDESSYNRAVEAVRRFHDAVGFDRKSVAARLGIVADIGNYQRREAA